MVEKPGVLCLTQCCFACCFFHGFSTACCRCFSHLARLQRCLVLLLFPPCKASVLLGAAAFPALQGFSTACCCFSAFHGFSTAWRHFFIQLYAAGQSSLFRNSRLFHQHAIVGLISILFQDRCCASARLFPPEKAFFFRRVRLLRLMLLRHKEHFSFSSPSAAYRAEHRSFSSLSATRLPRAPLSDAAFLFSRRPPAFTASLRPSGAPSILTRLLSAIPVGSLPRLRRSVPWTAGRR